ncbi:DUF1684 domain-containing protein [Nitriliruptoraceae bacterium ZYF776]|nr:DUF1684 domain-containing protein [Profundirhabdus halotolerans]
MDHDPFAPPPIDELDLLAHRRRVAELYAGVRRRGPGEDTWRWWVEQRDDLEATSPASIHQAGQLPFDGFAWHPYDPALRLGELEVAPADPFVLTIGHSGAGGTPARRFGTVDLPVGGGVHQVSVFWLDVYGGGVFLPLRDASNGTSTYGGGRYVLDTVKGADLGGAPGRLALDLNFAYHPSCVHDPRWSCPLAPAGERLPVEVLGGERLPTPRTTSPAARHR